MKKFKAFIKRLLRQSESVNQSVPLWIRCGGITRPYKDRESIK